MICKFHGFGLGFGLGFGWAWDLVGLGSGLEICKLD